MTSSWPFAGSLLAGPLCSTGPWPHTMQARCCDLRTRFRIKHTIRLSCRAIARNGRILLFADRPIEELPGLVDRVRLQTWHRIYPPGDIPQPHGVLLSVRGSASDENLVPQWVMYLRPFAEAIGELRIEVGGGMVLDLCRDTSNEPEA